MYQIKTIVNRLDNADEFDEEINRALADGWQTKEILLVNPNQPMNGTTYFHIMLVCTMLKEEAEE